MAPSFFSLTRFWSNEFYGVEPSKEKYQEINEALKFWNSAPQEHTEKNNIFTAPYTDLKSKPDTLVSSCYDFLNVRLEEKFKRQLQKEAAASKNYQSKHSYSAEEFI